MRLTTLLFVLVASVAADVVISLDTASKPPARPFFEVPTLLQIRDILTHLEAPIVTAIVERFALPVNPSLYAGKPSKLQTFLAAQENAAAKLGRYDYGSMEFGFTLTPPAPDVETSKVKFPPGRFHLDKFYGNANLTTLYTKTFVPLLNTGHPSSFYYRLSNCSNTPDSLDIDAALHLDASLLALMSHRCHIGKLVAEAKYAGNASQYATLIKAKNSAGIRTLLTNTTQEDVVMAQADSVAVNLITAWQNSGQVVFNGFETSVRVATQKIFRSLIDITTDIEIQYLLGRL